ncbi:MAG TPA: sigma-70 family RNA polymerase sigma factor [Polyangiaceae bacterium]|nr:sigma-70 family RNA polymerase sigma factor [Polyangiaceae bacterium]
MLGACQVHHLHEVKEASPRRLQPEREREIRAALVRHLPQLTAHAVRLTKDTIEAHDVVQEAALRALNFSWSYQAGSNARAWLHQILDSVFMTRCRRRAREKRAFRALTDDPNAWLKNGSNGSETRRLSPRVESALQLMPGSFRDVVYLVDVHGLSYKDAAETLRVPLGTVMSRLHRGRRLLAAELSDSTLSARAA